MDLWSIGQAFWTMQRYLYRAGDPYSVAWDIGLTTHEKVGASDDSDDTKDRALYSLFLLTIAPVVLFALVLFWEKHWNKQHKEHAKRRAAAANLVEPTQEAHLTKLMENYSMVSIPSLALPQKVEIGFFWFFTF